MLSARNWWLRSPLPSSAGSERCVGTSGALGYSGAGGGSGVAADYLSKISRTVSSSPRG
jgi:hypothetical protein